MSRWEFMRQLEELLSDISPSEKEEALQYYNDYFNDAGRENEQEVIKALGSPAQVAGIVRDGLNENISSGEFTESGFKNAASFQQNPIIKKGDSLKGDTLTGQKEGVGEDSGNNRNTFGNYENMRKDSCKDEQTGAYREGGAGTYGEDQNSFYREGTRGAYREDGSAAYDNSRTETKAEAEGTGAYADRAKNFFREKKENLPTWVIVLIIVGCIILAPAIIGGIGGILGGLLGIVASIAALVIGVAAAALVLYFAAVLLIVAGVGCIFVAPIRGIGLLGGGCICGALGIVCMLFTYLLVAKVIPGICRGAKYVYRKIADKIGGKR